MRMRRNELVMSRSTLQSIVFALVILLFADPLAFAARKGPPKDVLTQVTALGVGHWAVVWLKDGRQLTGTIAGIDATSFTLDRGRKHGPETLAFADVSKVRKSGITPGQSRDWGLRSDGGSQRVCCVGDQGRGHCSSVSRHSGHRSTVSAEFPGCAGFLRSLALRSLDNRRLTDHSSRPCHICGQGRWIACH